MMKKVKYMPASSNHLLQTYKFVEAHLLEYISVKNYIIYFKLSQYHFMTIFLQR